MLVVLCVGYVGAKNSDGGLMKCYYWMTTFCVVWVMFELIFAFVVRPCRAVHALCGLRLEDRTS